MSFPRESERGYNLVEVMVAMAILSSVLLSVITLFFFGRRNVYSGKQMTLANSVATRVSEDLVPLSSVAFQQAFGLTDATTLASTPVTVGGRQYTGVVVVHTGDTTTDPQGYLARWQALVTAQNFAGGRVSLVIEPTMALSANPFTTADIVRIRIVVEWNESRRNRTVVLDTVKINSINITGT